MRKKDRIVRKYGKIDDNHTSIVKALRKCGCSVQSLASVGGGCGDILCGYRKRNFLIEIKTATGKLTPDETDFHATWRGQIAVARTFEEAWEVVND